MKEINTFIVVPYAGRVMRCQVPSVADTLA